MIKVIKHSTPEYETNCCCGAILQFREDDIDYDIPEYVGKIEFIICPDCGRQIFKEYFRKLTP